MPDPFYGDLDVSCHQRIAPWTRHHNHLQKFPLEKAQGSFIKKAQGTWHSKGTQAYIIYPLVDESEKLDLKAAKDMFVHLQKFEFQGVCV